MMLALIEGAIELSKLPVIGWFFKLLPIWIILGCIGGASSTSHRYSKDDDYTYLYDDVDNSFPDVHKANYQRILDMKYGGNELYSKSAEKFGYNTGLEFYKTCYEEKISKNQYYEE